MSTVPVFEVRPLLGSFVLVCSAGDELTACTTAFGTRYSAELEAERLERNGSRSGFATLSNRSDLDRWTKSHDWGFAPAE